MTLSQKCKRKHNWKSGYHIWISKCKRCGEVRPTEAIREEAEEAAN